jgi:hypothetical protein
VLKQPDKYKALSENFEKIIVDVWVAGLLPEKKDLLRRKRHFFAAQPAKKWRPLCEGGREFCSRCPADLRYQIEKIVLELDCWSWGGQYLPLVNPRRSRGSL